MILRKILQAETSAKVKSWSLRRRRICHAGGVTPKKWRIRQSFWRRSAYGTTLTVSMGIKKRLMALLPSDTVAGLHEKMFSQRAQIAIAVLLLGLFFTSSVLAAPADDVVPLIDRDYFTVTCKAMQGANKSILFVTYEAQLSVNHPFGGESLMLRELISAKNRGVDVRVILEGDPERNNTYAYDFLKNAGVNVSYDADNITTHSSFMVIDDEYTILGSHNWTIGGQRMNHEASVFIRSKDVAKAMRTAFEQIAVKKEPKQETKK